MNPSPIPFARPSIDDADREAVQRVLRGPILAHGPEGKAFEVEFARFVGPGAHAVAVSSCMAALHLAYLQMGLGPGDEVVVTAQTHVATAHAVEAVGARPVFADCDPRTGNLDASQVEAKLTPRTKAIALVHFLGIPCDMDAILALARDRGLKVVEDCALALGARWRGTHAGLLGDAGCFSFYPVKQMTTGEGGMLVTRHPEVAAQVSRLRAFGIDRSHGERALPGIYDVVGFGLNYRMGEVQAALGRAQLARAPALLAAREANYRRLADQLRGAHGLRVLEDERPQATTSRYCLSVVLPPRLARQRDAVAARLQATGVGTSVYYPHPVPRLAYYRTKYGYRAGSMPAAEIISDGSLALPVGPHLGPADMDRVAEELLRALKEVEA